MKFTYKAKNRKGEKRSGKIEALNIDEAKNALLIKDLIVISVKPLEERVKKSYIVSLLGGVSFLDKLLFAKNLALMLKAGLSLRESVDIIMQQSKSMKFRFILEDVLVAIDNGYPLARALSRHQAVFGPFYVNMIRAGEESGSIESNLEYLAMQLERSNDLIRKVKTAMIYPVIILVAMGVLTTGITLFVLPKITPIFKSFKIKLPLATRILISFTSFAEKYGLYILAGLFVSTIVFMLLKRIKFVQYMLDSFVLRIPIVGSITKSLHLSSFTRNLSILLKSGIAVVQSLDIAVSTESNMVFKKEIIKASETVKRGRPMSDSLKRNRRVFPIMVSRMIEVGEKTGDLEGVLLYLSSFYDLEVDTGTKNISALLEPVLLLAIGASVGFLALAILSPIYEVTRGFKF
jgi:type IV pilus assembly protein PilC